jgi:CarD family transcriptional regulator
MFVEPDCRELEGQNCPSSGISRVAAAALFPFTPVLAGMVAAGLGIEAIHLYLELSRTEILDRLAALGLPVPHSRPVRKGGKHAWTGEDVRHFIELWLSGVRIRGIAAVLDRSPGALYSKRRRLGLPTRPRKGQVDLSELEIEARRSAWRTRCEDRGEERGEASRPQTEEPAAPTASGEAKQPFEPGELVVVPALGIGEVLAMETQEVAGTALDLFAVSIVKSKIILKVPAPKLASAGLRKLSNPATVNTALAILADGKGIKASTPRRRMAEYEAKIKSGDFLAMAEVVRDLHVPKEVAEKSLYETARDRLTHEIGLVQKITEAEAAKLVATRLPPPAHLQETLKQQSANETRVREAGVERAMKRLGQLWKGPKKRLIGRDPEFLAEIAVRTLAGQHPGMIGEEMGVTKSTVHNWVYKMGLTDRTRKRVAVFDETQAFAYLGEQGLVPRTCGHYRRLFFARRGGGELYSPEYYKKSETVRREKVGVLDLTKERKRIPRNWKGLCTNPLAVEKPPPQLTVVCAGENEDMGVVGEALRAA